MWLINKKLWKINIFMKCHINYNYVGTSCALSKISAPVPSPGMIMCIRLTALRCGRYGCGQILSQEVIFLHIIFKKT